MEDLLSEIVRSVRLRGTVYFHAVFRAPWGMAIPQGQFANFHLITAGSCWLKSEMSKSPSLMRKGDMVIFPQGDSHSLLQDPDTEPVSAEEVLLAVRDQDPAGAVVGGTGEATTEMICGHFEYDQTYPHPLFDTLAPIIHIPAKANPDPDWLAITSNLAASISLTGQPGANAIVDKLAEVLFIQAIISHIESMNEPVNFVAAVQDAGIGRALTLMHSDVSYDWNLEELAQSAAMSRSVFAEKFRNFVGEPPMVYLAKWRMLKARELLGETSISISEISERVGYQSEFSFAKAFKRVFGVSPGSIRKHGNRTH